MLLCNLQQVHAGVYVHHTSPNTGRVFNSIWVSEYRQSLDFLMRNLKPKTRFQCTYSYCSGNVQKQASIQPTCHSPINQIPIPVYISCDWQPGRRRSEFFSWARHRFRIAWAKGEVINKYHGWKLRAAFGQTRNRRLELEFNARHAVIDVRLWGSRKTRVFPIWPPHYKSEAGRLTDNSEPKL